MTCKEIERLIHPYLNGELSEKKTKAYLNHMKQCEACYEEMEIVYMSTIGLERLESGASIDIEMEMDKLLQQSEKKLKQRGIIKLSGVICDVIAMVIVLFTLAIQMNIWFEDKIPVLKEIAFINNMIK